jgi:hypothetical protein
LAKEILYVAVSHFALAVVGVLREVVDADDSELAKFDDGANFGLAQAIAAIAVVKHGASVPELEFRTAVLHSTFR